MESKVFLSYEEARKLDDLWYNVLEQECEEILLERVGLRAVDPCAWFDSNANISLLEIIDEKRWLLAKIKYGI